MKPRRALHASKPVMRGWLSKKVYVYYLVAPGVAAIDSFNVAAESKIWSWTPQELRGCTLHQDLPADLFSSPIWYSSKLLFRSSSLKTAFWTWYVVDCKVGYRCLGKQVNHVTMGTALRECEVSKQSSWDYTDNCGYFWIEEIWGEDWHQYIQAIVCRRTFVDPRY